jgi:hypothetical protein
MPDPVCVVPDTSVLYRDYTLSSASFRGFYGSRPLAKLWLSSQPWHSMNLGTNIPNAYRFGKTGQWTKGTVA